METRNIKLTLEKAREFYRKGGEFRDLALSAFSEKEIIGQKLPKTWEEFCSNIDHLGGYYIDYKSNILYRNYKLERINSEIDKNVCPSSKDAKAHLALMQLHQLRDCYRQGWIPDWNDLHEDKYCITIVEDNIYMWRSHNHYFLSFQKEELAEQFLKNFRDLIEQAGDLI